MANEKSMESTSDPFEEVAAQVTAAPAAAEPQTVASPKPVAAVPVSIVVRRDVAVGCVKLVFVPFALKDKRWLVSDEEAEVAAEPMREFLQVVLDKYLPELIGKYAHKNPELANLTVALTLVIWRKSQSIRAMDAQKPAAAAPAASASAMPVAVDETAEGNLRR